MEEKDNVVAEKKHAREEKHEANPDVKETQDIKLFGKYDFNVELKDPGLARVISIKPVLMPKSGGKTSQQRLARGKVNIVERLITHLMVPGHKGKKHLRSSKLASGRFYTAFTVVDESFDRIQKEGKSPIQVLIKAVENSAPKEEVMSLLISGQRIAKQVDTSPMRRLDLALRWIAQGTFQLSFSGKKASDALHDILIGAANNQDSVFPISKKIDTERQADSSR
ncbi:MAG: 30S ribosomal protein S7 [Candidatus Parvarchaeota archaeon]|nr:30S ribosomal protein S7 [Candidatus Parvarchaeota archaeon]